MLEAISDIKQQPKASDRSLFFYAFIPSKHTIAHIVSYLSET